MAKSVLQGKGQIRCDPPYSNRGLGGLGGMGLGRGLSRAGAPGTAMSSTLLGPPMEGMTLKQEDGGCGTGGGSSPCHGTSETPSSALKLRLITEPICINYKARGKCLESLRAPELLRPMGATTQGPPPKGSAGVCGP